MCALPPQPLLLPPTLALSVLVVSSIRAEALEPALLFQVPDDFKVNHILTPKPTVGAGGRLFPRQTQPKPVLDGQRDLARELMFELMRGEDGFEAVGVGHRRG